MFALVGLENFPHVPKCVAFARVVCLALRVVEFLAAEAQQLFEDFRRTVVVVGYQYFQMVGEGEGSEVELSTVE